MLIPRKVYAAARGFTGYLCEFDAAPQTFAVCQREIFSGLISVLCTLVAVFGTYFFLGLVVHRLYLSLIALLDRMPPQFHASG